MVSVLIPAYNEAERIGLTIRHLMQSMKGEDYEIIVIDDGSEDGTSDEAKKAGATVITLSSNIGKGGAMNQGIKTAKGDILLFIDADLAESAGMVPSLLVPIYKGEADLTIAGFPQTKNPGGFGLVKRLAQHGLLFFTGNYFDSPISGQRALTRRVLESIGAFEHGWGVEVGMTIAAYYHGFKIHEVPLALGHRESERSIKGFFHRGYQFRDICRTFVKAYWQYKVLFFKNKFLTFFFKQNIRNGRLKGGGK